MTRESTLVESIAAELRNCFSVEGNEIALADGSVGFVDGISESIADRVEALTR